MKEAKNRMPVPVTAGRLLGNEHLLAEARAPALGYLQEDSDEATPVMEVKTCGNEKTENEGSMHWWAPGLGDLGGVM